MTINEHIPTEIIQTFSSSEVFKYHIIPYEKEGDNNLKCYGKEGVDYASLINEVEVIYGISVTLTLLNDAEFDRGLNLYYRKGKTSQSNINISQINDRGFINSLIEDADSLRSSDIHIEPYEKQCRVRMRIDGKLVERYIIEQTDYPALVNKIKILSSLDISKKRLPQDGRILFERANQKFDVRVSVLPTIYGEKIVLRLLTREQNLLEIRNLGFSEKQYNDYISSVQNPHGLVLISGPTGSGKSTTLYATLRYLNREDNNILTIEDPVEYTLPGINQVQLNEEIGLTFGKALRTFLRQDPDIIMLGEIRDQDTANMAIRSSLTGHMLLSTIHTNSAWGSVTRLIDMGVQPYLISDTLIACVAQRLVRLLCPHCKKQYKLDDNICKALNLNNQSIFYKAVGCDECYYTGYKGRKAIYEVIKMDTYLADAVRSGVTDVDNYFLEKQVTTLKDSALSLLKEGETSFEEIYINGYM
ncbi:GspE/PulE family protein [Bacteroides ovatus]|uniref:GspE/PulE family protein n=1 Tax=Bacteroides ovatus TaxID=28116 RepID=UPI00202EAC74|nr:GspE/PulE family protein [Bacteroides ovatus]MCM1722617.1 GspE/PulE family protein [Bacteroides ovatus]MCM1758924.1 GspE/PulE family protein [Bacteroides ovatus]MCM1869039.1 GspE/PulE family protein [Bacteroides ovatus]MCM1912440.1 GspE/PulE family protein [Bacteroides ovatus]